MLWAALVQGTSGRSGGVLYYVYGSPDEPANLQVTQADSSFTLRQHLLTPEQVAGVRALPLAAWLHCLLASPPAASCCAGTC